MTPDKLAKSGTEHAHQVALFAYCAVAHIHGFDIADAWCKEGNAVFKNSGFKLGDRPAVPALQWLHAIPNGGSRGDDARSRKIRGAQLKAEGVKSGIPDIFLPWPSKKFNGLYIEMKKPEQKPKTETSKGGLSHSQISFKNYAKKVGYAWEVCYSWQDAARAIKKYIFLQRYEK